MQTAVLIGLLPHNAREFEQDVLVQCPSGNCTWGPFGTLGVCHQCNDITGHLSRVNASDSMFINILDATLGLKG